MRARFVNEELIGTYDQTDQVTIEMWMNPATARRMGPWARAMSDEEGNFFIASPQEIHQRDRDYIATTHTDMLSYLQSQGWCQGMKWQKGDGGGGYGYYLDGMAWQQDNNTKNFYISESYSVNWGKENELYIEQEHINKIHVQYVKLIPRRIPLTWDDGNEQDDIEDYHRKQAEYF